MNNPGQNYKGKIEGGNTKLFLIVTPNNMSGLELRLVEDSVFKQVQILSYCNKETSEYHNIISSIFVNYVNMLHLKKTYESKINNFITLDMMNRSMLVNVTDDDTSKNSKSFGFLAPVENRYDEPMEMNVVEERPRFRNVRMELENLPDLDNVRMEAPEDEIDGYDYDYPDARA
jgi:hypothetical protein